MKKIHNEDEALTDQRNQMARAVAAGKWLSMTWRIEDGRLILERVMWDFPHDDFDECVNQLQKELDAVKRQAKRDPLPSAPPLLSPRFDLFKGNGE